MQTKEITVTDANGVAEPATLVICDCGGEMFHIYYIDKHRHLQCVDCGKSYCDGSCSVGGPYGRPFRP